MLRTAATSISITVTVSLAVAFFCTTLGLSFWSPFLLATVLQFIIWYIIDYFTQLKVQQEFHQAIRDSAEQSIIIPCAYCKLENLVPIRFDENNTFDCTECNKQNAVYMDIESTQVTVPVDTEQTIKINERLQ